MSPRRWISGSAFKNVPFTCYLRMRQSGGNGLAGEPVLATPVQVIVVPSLSRKLLLLFLLRDCIPMLPVWVVVGCDGSLQSRSLPGDHRLKLRDGYRLAEQIPLE